MKRALLLLALLPVAGFSQTRTTISDGNFLNPFVWDCTCIPASGDSVFINHNIVMNSDIYYTSGRITINASGSLMEDGTDRAYWADGTGSLVNFGEFKTHTLLISTSAEMSNSGTMTQLDSVWNQGMVTNTGSMQIYDLLNDETANFVNSETVTIDHDFNNQGYFFIDASASVSIGHDFSNCNIQNLDAVMENDGIVCITNDFSNCGGDTLTGSGDYFVGGAAANLGVFTGTFTFHTPSGTLAVSGTIDPGVSVTTGSCNLQLDQLEAASLKVFPNPTNGTFTVNANEGIESIEVFDLFGRPVFVQVDLMHDKVDANSLPNGYYIVRVQLPQETLQTKILIKK